MKTDSDPWGKLAHAWQRENRLHSPDEAAEDSPPFGFSARVISQWRSARHRSPAPSFLGIWEKCAVRGAFAAVAALLASAALLGGSKPPRVSSPGLISIPPIDLSAIEMTGEKHPPR